MASNAAFIYRYRLLAFTLLRIVAGLMLMQHGAQKLFGALGGAGGTGAAVPLLSLMGLAAVLEFFGGGLVALGLFTRPVAFVLSGEMAVAYFSTHAPKGFWPLANGGELAVLYAFVFFFVASAGSGPFSLDASIGRRRRAFPIFARGTP